MDNPVVVAHFRYVDELLKPQVSQDGSRGRRRPRYILRVRRLEKGDVELYLVQSGTGEETRLALFADAISITATEHALCIAEKLLARYPRRITGISLAGYSELLADTLPTHTKVIRARLAGVVHNERPN